MDLVQASCVTTGTSASGWISSEIPTRPFPVQLGATCGGGKMDLNDYP